jgi:hypothetical protein
MRRAVRDGTLQRPRDRGRYSGADARVNEAIYPREEITLNKRTLLPVIHDNRTRPQRIARLTSTKEFDHA